MVPGRGKKLLSIHETVGDRRVGGYLEWHSRALAYPVTPNVVCGKWAKREKHGPAVSPTSVAVVRHHNR